jgi:transcriptional regulator with XRE-family HTH domain
LSEGGEIKLSIVAENVERIIRENGLKKRAVAERAGFSQKAFSAMLHGRKLILAEHVIAIARALNKSPNDLYGICAGGVPASRQSPVIHKHHITI